jgi:hypothetical protein
LWKTGFPNDAATKANYRNILNAVPDLRILNIKGIYEDKNSFTLKAANGWCISFEASRLIHMKCDFYF